MEQLYKGHVDLQLKICTPTWKKIYGEGNKGLRKMCQKESSF